MRWCLVLPYPSKHPGCKGASPCPPGRGSPVGAPALPPRARPSYCSADPWVGSTSLGDVWWGQCPVVPAPAQQRGPQATSFLHISLLLLPLSGGAGPRACRAARIQWRGPVFAPQPLSLPAICLLCGCSLLLRHGALVLLHVLPFAGRAAEPQAPTAQARAGGTALHPQMVLPPLLFGAREGPGGPRLLTLGQGVLWREGRGGGGREVRASTGGGQGV